MKINLKSEKGISVINIAITIIVLFIFVSLLAVISYNINSSAKEIELKSKATSYAVNEIEEIKYNGFEELPTENIEQEEITDENGEGTSFYKTVKIEDYADTSIGQQNEAIAGIVKKVIVQIQYKFKGQVQTVELSTILTKEN